MPGAGRSLPDRIWSAVRGTLTYQSVRVFVAATVVYAFVGTYIVLTLSPYRSPPTIVVMTAVVLAIAAAYAVFGERNVDAAVDQTTDLADGGGGSGDSTDEEGDRP